MKHTQLKYLLFIFILPVIFLCTVKAAPVKADSTEPSPRVVMLLIKFKQEEKDIQATIVTIGLVNGIVKKQSAPFAGNNVTFYVNTISKDKTDSLQISSPLQAQYEYPIENNKMAYKTVAVKEKTVLLRFAWQAGLKSLKWYWPATENKQVLPAVQELLLPKSITQPD